jgi:hypothetical protein
LPGPQRPPARGTVPRTRTARTARRASRLRHQLIGYLDGDGVPTVAPVRITGHNRRGLTLRGAPGLFPPGARRAGLLAHDYRPQLHGLRTRYLTGWLVADSDNTDCAVYAPHTDKGYRAPGNKTLLLLLNGGLTKLGVRRAVRRGEITAWPTPMRRSPGSASGQSR